MFDLYLSFRQKEMWLDSVDLELGNSRNNDPPLPKSVLLT